MKALKKDIMARYTCVSIGYCGAQFALRGGRRTAHTEGVYGWNADVYACPFGNMPDLAIVTGYRPFGVKPNETEYVKLLNLERRARNGEDMSGEVWLWAADVARRHWNDLSRKALKNVRRALDGMEVVL